jgi:ABC-2 type transport system permease protein
MGVSMEARVAAVLRGAVWSARCGLQDHLAMFTLRTWLLGWFVRVLSQVLFFALAGRLLGSEATTRYLFVGNAAVVAAIVTHGAIASTAWERQSGSLPLLVAAPATPLLVFTARSVNWILDAVASSVGAFVVVGALLGWRLAAPQLRWLLVLVPLTSVTAYCVSIAVGALVLRALDLRSVVANLLTLTVLIVGGVNVPVEVLPDAARWVATILPATHMVAAVRFALAGAGGVMVWERVGLASVTAAAWLLVAAALFTRFIARGRRVGDIEFGD